MCATSHFLKLMHRSIGICKLCQIAEENSQHLLFQCPIINPVWDCVVDKLQTLLNGNLVLDLEAIIFGLDTTKSIEEGNRNKIVNCFVFETKWQIWKNRNNVKFGKKNSATVEHLFEKIIMCCKIQLELYTNKSSGKLNNKFKQILCEILENI